MFLEIDITPIAKGSQSCIDKLYGQKYSYMNSILPSRYEISTSLRHQEDEEIPGCHPDRAGAFLRDQSKHDREDRERQDIRQLRDGGEALRHVGEHEAQGAQGP